MTNDASAHLNLHRDLLGGTWNSSLKKLCLDGVAPSWGSSSSDDPSMSQIIDILHSCPELESLTLKFSLHSVREPSPSVRVTLPYLQHLHLIMSDIMICNFLVSIFDIPRDVKVTLHFPDHWGTTPYMQIPITWAQHITSESMPGS
ncbi:hypothetical protein BD410DRAFT_783354 [Rickenella mellea]|uniref:F-box domain-containing protein n=1 Tax=Rickenella mellea TaxID=50990 RepID=A0A4Y7QHN1_9AGAM|nr:hypothetical protein BD410DRAFT_783354 [Rickenella mellea]